MKKIFFALLLFFPVHCHALTWSQIRTEIRVRIKDTDSTRRRYSDTQLLNLANQTQRDVVNVSWIIKKSTDIVLATGTTYYTMPSDFMQIHRITFRNTNLPENSLQGLDSRFNFSDWLDSGGYPDSYFQDPARPASIGIYPWPDSSSSTGTIHVIYYSQGTDLSSDSDVPFNSDNRYVPYHDLLIFDPAYKVFLIEGDAAKAGEYKAYYESRLQILLATLGNKPNFLPGFSSQRR